MKKKSIIFVTVLLTRFALAETIQLPGEHHFNMSIEAFSGIISSEVQATIVSHAMKAADQYCKSMGMNRIAFFYEKEYSGKNVTVKLTDAFCSTNSRGLEDAAHARLIIYRSRQSRNLKIDATQNVISERNQDKKFTGFKSVDASTFKNDPKKEVKNESPGKS